MQSLQLEAQITDLEEEKVNLSNELIERNREALVWEKKLIMAKETKAQMDQEKQAEGEIGTMKAEIHRMSVRLTQLKRAQDKLIQDLNGCVSRRDSIITTAEARGQSKVRGQPNKVPKMNYQRSLDDVKNKIKKFEMVIPHFTIKH